MIQLELPPELEAQLAEDAGARGLDLNRYVENLVTGHVQRKSTLAERSEAVASIRKLREGNALGGLSIRDLINEGRKY